MFECSSVQVFKESKLYNAGALISAARWSRIGGLSELDIVRALTPTDLVKFDKLYDGLDVHLSSNKDQTSGRTETMRPDCPSAAARARRIEHRQTLIVSPASIA